jgi:nucleotide-binding universal stress UspA family protein
MHQYKQLLVAMNADEHDEATLRYAAVISRMAESERVFFVHVVKLDVPKNVLDEYPALLNMIQDDAKDKMKKLIKKHFKDYSDAIIEYEVVNGSPLMEIIRKIREKKVDLVITGEDSVEEVKRKLPEKLIRKSPCSVLSVPKGSKPEINKILAPLDFSPHSAETLDVALAFGRAAHLLEIDTLHAYSVPRGFQMIGKSYEEFAEKMKDNTKIDYRNFIATVDRKGIKVNPNFLLEDNPGKAINDFIHKNGTDLLVIGTRGRTNSAALLLGSVAEHLIHHAQIPLVAVKIKDEKIGFIDALFEI